MWQYSESRSGYRWWFYREASSGAGDVRIVRDREREAELQLGADAAGMEIHVILEVTDSGAPSLTRYRRLIVSVKDRK